MIGLHQPVEIGGVAQQPVSNPAPTQNKVIGVICSGDVAVYRDQVKTALERGLEQRPDAVWVCVEPKSDHMTHDVMLSLDIDPVVLPMIGSWRGTSICGHEDAEDDGKNLICCDCGATFPLDEDEDDWQPETVLDYDLRRQWRDAEMMLCDELIVFHKRTGSSPWRDRKKWSDNNAGVHSNLFVVELGPEPVKKRAKTRKPVGA